MKKLIPTVIAATVLAGCLGLVFAQGSPAKTTADPPHKIALIDMAKVFKKYDKFNDRRAVLKQEIAKSDAQARAMAKQGQTISDQMKSTTLKKDSPTFLDLEKQLSEIKSKLRSFQEVQRTRFLRMESQLYREIYVEVIDVVQRAAEAWGYTLVLRFNNKPLDESDPKGVITSLNKQVVYHRPNDDITGPVIDFLNKKYTAQVSKPAPPAAKKSKR